MKDEHTGINKAVPMVTMNPQGTGVDYNNLSVYLLKIFLPIFQREICRTSVKLRYLNLANPSNFQSLEAVDRSSETQLQVTEN